MKLLYKIALILGSLIHSISSIPIIPHDTNINLDPAIVVTHPRSSAITTTIQPTTEFILYNTDDTVGAIVPPPPPPAPPGPIYSVYQHNETHAKLVLSSGEIIYTPLDITPFIMSPFSDLEPVVVKHRKPINKGERIEHPVI